MKNLILSTLLIIIAVYATDGCAPAPIVKPEATQPTAGVKAEQPNEKAINDTYNVVKGDCLWKISARPDIYSDPFEWPLLFKANRDQIQDPDLIEINQELAINKDYTQEQVNDAIQKAKDTPTYKQHSKPRKKLPLKY